MADLSCPVPFSQYERVVMAHGAGGRVMQRLITELFVAEFGGEHLSRGHDGAVLDLAGPVAVTTDAFTISPRFFPGGDIGSLSVHGTVNDLAMCGARPEALTVSFVLEEGLALHELQTIVRSMAQAARDCGVSIVTGDTKVVERGHGDGVYITTTGIGPVLAREAPHPGRVEEGDLIVVSGPVGDHGTAVMVHREGLELEEPLISDAAPVHREVLALLDAGVVPHCLRDPTRGGLAAALGEVAAQSRLCMRLGGEIPVRPVVRDVCELLGLDPLQVACEGRFVAWLAAEDAERAVGILREAGSEAVAIGRVQAAPAGLIVQDTSFGGERVIDVPAGAPLPRIC